jgi:hypothetical protein
MATDYQSLVRTVQDYASSGNASGAMLLKLALLRSIAINLNPLVATDFQSLMSDPDVPGYLNSSDASVAAALEMALLKLISGLAGQGVQNGSGSPIVNAVPPLRGGLYYDTTNKNLWASDGITWDLLV